MKNVLKNTADICVVESEMIKRLKRAAERSPVRRARYCLHRRETDCVQEMLVVLCKDTQIPIHRHETSASESYYIIEGKASVLLYNEKGHLLEQIALGDTHSGRPSLYRLSVPLWHTVSVESEFLVMHEVASGPFVRSAEHRHPPWLESIDSLKNIDKIEEE